MTKEEKKIRSPIVSVLGHVDHGKSSILDAIRGTNILAVEPGAITQAIGASIIPLETIKKKTGKLLDSIGQEIKIPGLLFIDTPGHAAFTSLRKRGGALADIAILVVDINEGFRPQTKEAIKILTTSKTPFIVAANKIDLIPGYKQKEKLILNNIAAQTPEVRTEIEKRIYELVGAFYDGFKLQSERFDRVEDFTKQLAIIPCSAVTGSGIPELLMMITGLAQKYLENNLRIEVSGPAKGTILEVKESKGLGTTIDVIIYEGTIRRNDTVVIGGLEKPVVVKVRALLLPAPNAEMRDKKAKFKPCNEVVASSGVKIAAPGLEGVISGMPLVVARDNIEEAKEEVMKEVELSIIETDKEGVIIKADTLGSLEALSTILKEKKIPIRKAGIGPITKKDIADAESNYEKNPVLSVILGFNIPEQESTEKVTVITDRVIYKLIERFEEWRDDIKRRMEAEQLKELVRPCKVEVLQNCIFRQSNPAIVGVEVIEGLLSVGVPLIKKDGTRISTVKSIQQEKESVSSASKGLQVAISLPGVVAGRHINEYDILLSDIPEDDFKRIKNLKDYLTQGELEILKEVAEIKRKYRPLWGV